MKTDTSTTASIPVKGYGNTEGIIAAVAKATGVPGKKILSKSKVWPCVEARLLLILLLSHTGLVDQKIAWTVGRGRASVCKSRHVAEDLLDVSKTFRQKFIDLKKTIEL